MSVPDITPRRSATLFALQAILWCALTFAVGGLFALAGPFDLRTALRVSAANWLPWAVFMPLVFWLARKYPLERGRLRRNVPVHAGAGLVIALLSFGATVLAFPPRGETRFDGPPPPFGHGAAGVPPPPPGTFGPVAPWPPSAPPGSPAMSWLMPLVLRGNFGVSIYLIVLSVAHALAFRRKAEERDRHALHLAADLHRSRLNALRLQLQPHFLFNTLNAVSAFVGRNPQKADELINALSVLLRASLETEDDEVPLAREMELLDRYLTIEQSRLGRRLRVVREVAAGLDAALVPPLLLQSLAENAVRHGIEPGVALGTITIRASREAQRLRLTVTDDGIGLVTHATNRGRPGIGLENTAQRLKTLYGSEARFEIVSLPERGVRVDIELPYHTAAITKPGAGL